MNFSKIYLNKKLMSTPIETKEYELKLENSKYLLKMTLLSSDVISINIKQINDLSFHYYYGEFKYDELIELLDIGKRRYNEISKIYKLCDGLISRNQIKIINSKEKEITLIINREEDGEVLDCKLILKEKNTTNDEILETKINLLTERINLLSEENKNLKKLFDKYGKYLDEKIQENIKENEMKQKEKEEYEIFKKQNTNVSFKENPQNLKFVETLTENNNNYDAPFDVYKSLSDKEEYYLIFGNKTNYNLEIMKINDKTSIRSLRGHKDNLKVIKYYSKDNKEEYILSCDSKFAIIWDIQNNFNRKYTIQNQYKSDINDALLLFNVFNNDYIVLSSNSDDEFCKLYEFKENTKFVKYILGTFLNEKLFIIPWFYKNKYYIIEGGKLISINNMLEDENYANLFLGNKNNENNNIYYISGYIFKDIYLCANSNQAIIIWNLVNKILCKVIQINDNSLHRIIPWNNSYAISGSNIINIEESKVVEKLDYYTNQNSNNAYVYSLRKIKISQFGECLIVSDSSSKINLFSL